MTDTTDNDRTYERIVAPPGSRGEMIAHVTKIVLGEIEEHPDEPERYWRYVYIMTHDTDLVLELSAGRKEALALIPLAEYQEE